MAKKYLIDFIFICLFRNFVHFSFFNRRESKERTILGYFQHGAHCAVSDMAPIVRMRRLGYFGVLSLNRAISDHVLLVCKENYSDLHSCYALLADLYTTLKACTPDSKNTSLKTSDPKADTQGSCC